MSVSMIAKSFLHNTTCLALVAAAAGTAVLAQSAVSGPASGFTFASGEFRPVLGMPGSAHLGPSTLRTGSSGWVAPNGISAITAGENGIQFIANLSQAAAVQLDEAILPSSVFWSDDSTIVVLYSAEQQALQFSTILSQNAAKMKAPIRLDEIGVLGAPLAVNPAAGLAAVCLNTGLGIFSEKGLTTTPVRCDGLSAAVFAGDDALYVAGNGQILEIGDWENGSTVRTLIESEGASGPVAAAVYEGADGRMLILANASSGRLYVYNTVTSRETERFDLDYKPSSLDQLGLGRFLLNRDRRPSEPLLVFQVLPPHAVTFIPSGE
jgi:hypothetical protein